MPLRVMLIDEDSGRAAILEQALKDNGFNVVERVTQDSLLPETIRRCEPDIIIVDMDSPDRDILESMRNITRDQPKPIVMFSDNDDEHAIAQAVKAGVSAYIVDDISSKRLKPILDVAIARFREYQALRHELNETKSLLADRKDIDRAKGLLMKQRNISEDEAYSLLRKTAMDRNIKIGDAARMLVAAAELLG